MPCSKIPPLCECEITQQWQSPPRRSSSPGPSPCGSTDPDEVEALHMIALTRRDGLTNRGLLTENTASLRAGVSNLPPIPARTDVTEVWRGTVQEACQQLGGMPGFNKGPKQRRPGPTQPRAAQ
ncbi:hypothetical protein FKM82_011282 [Ascaphus truei]